MATPPQNPTPRLSALDKQLSSRQRVEDKIVSKVTKKMLSDSTELFERVQRRINRLDIDRFGNIKQTNKNQQAVNDINQLLDQGTAFISRSAIRELRAQTIQLEGHYFRELFAQDSALNQDQVAKLIGSNQTRAVLNTNLDNIASVGNSFSKQVRTQLTATLYENIGADEMADRLRESLIGKTDKKGNLMTRHADTIAKTAYNAYANALTLQNVNQNDIVAYYYSGAQDDRNRQFCSVRVGKTLESEKLEGDIQGNSGGSLQNAGGWNCRHKLFPVSKFDEEAKPFLSEKERIEIFGE